MWVAVRRFIGVVGGVERIFAPGDKITDAEASSMGLEAKPGLAIKEAKRAEPQKA